MLLTTLYIDVYFLINLTVDILSAYFASRAVNMKTTVKRLMGIGILGGVLAVLDVLFRVSFALRLFYLILMLFGSGAVISKNATPKRRVRFVFAFLFFEMFVGGGVYYGYILIDRYFGEYLAGADGGVHRREIIILSLLILFVIGVLKLLIMVFGGERFIRSCRIRIEIDGKSEDVDALIDSGNLVRDPMNMYPVLFVKKGIAKRLFPTNVIDLTNIDELDSAYRKRIRLIPVTKNGKTHVLTGVRTDKVSIVHEGNEDEVLVTLAIDKEEGSFGGYDALLPSAILEDGI